VPVLIARLTLDYHWAANLKIQVLDLGIALISGTGYYTMLLLAI
jgi:hypothetical protein